MTNSESAPEMPIRVWTVLMASGEHARLFGARMEQVNGGLVFLFGGRQVAAVAAGRWSAWQEDINE